MSNNVQFDTGSDYSRKRRSKKDDQFQLVRWLQKKGIVNNKRQGYWVALGAAAIMFALSVYFFSTALGGPGGETEGVAPVTPTTTAQETMQP